jgi:hypothetical protein
MLDGEMITSREEDVFHLPRHVDRQVERSKARTTRVRYEPLALLLRVRIIRCVP